MFILNNICNDVELLNILAIIKSVIELVTIVIPVILTIYITIDIVKSTTSSEVDTKKLFQAISKRIIAAVFIFLIPFIIDFVLNIIPNQKLYYLDCYKKAEKNEIINIAEVNSNDLLNELERIVNDCNDVNGCREEVKNEFYPTYENARVAVKLIPNASSKKHLHERKLKDLKNKFDQIK